MANGPVQFVISDEVLDALEEIADARGVSLEDALKEAIATERVIMRETRDGARILIKKPDKPARELLVS
jgi:hypothetical protein